MTSRICWLLLLISSQVLLTYSVEVNKIKKLDVKCGDQDMLVDIEFTQPFNGIVFSKGYFARNECVYVKASPSKYSYEFTIAYSSCGTTAGGSGVGSSGARRSDGFLRKDDEEDAAAAHNRTRRDTEPAKNLTAQGRSLFGGMPGMFGGGAGGPEFPPQGDPYAQQMQNMDYSGGMGAGGGGMMGDPYSGAGQQQSWQPMNQNPYAPGMPPQQPQQYGSNNFGAGQQFAGGMNVPQQQQGGVWNGQGAFAGSQGFQQQQQQSAFTNQQVVSGGSNQQQGGGAVFPSGAASSVPGSAAAVHQEEESQTDFQTNAASSKVNEPFGEDRTGGASRFFENIIIIQYDANIQEVWDVAKALRCEWHDNYHKTVSYKPFQVDSLEVVPATFAGDNVGVWMTVQQGKGPYAPEVNGIVRIGEYLTLAIGIQDETKKFDMRVINCFASDGNRPSIQLIDEYGCVTRPKIMSDVAKVTDYGDQASVVSYAYFQAFKFPDSVDVQLECSVEICKSGCAKQCYNRMLGDSAVPLKSSLPKLTSHVSSGLSFGGSSSSMRVQGRKVDGSSDVSVSSAASQSGKSSSSASSSSAAAAEINRESVDAKVLQSLQGGKMVVKVSSGTTPRSGAAAAYNKLGADEEDVTTSGSTRATLRRKHKEGKSLGDAGGDDEAYRRKRDTPEEDLQKNVGIKRKIRVVSPGDLSFFNNANKNDTIVYTSAQRMQDNVCISSTGFVAGIVVLIALLILTTMTSLMLCLRLRSLDRVSNKHKKEVDMEYIKHTM